MGRYVFIKPTNQIIMMPGKSKVIRIGDFIEIVTSKFVKRVGYPIVWTDLLSEVARDPRTKKAWDILTDAPASLTSSPAEQFLAVGSNPEEEFPKDFLRAIAQHRVEMLKYGGNERSIHYYETKSRPPLNELFSLNASGTHRYDCTGYKASVIGKKACLTGTRIAPSSGTSGYWEPEDWYDAGGLDNCKTHVLLETGWGWIEACNVELISRAPGSTDKYPVGSKYLPKSKIG